MARDAASVQIEHDALWATIVDNVKSQQQAETMARDAESVQIEHDALCRLTIVDNVKSQ